MLFALVANLRVEMVSSACMAAGVMVQMMAVREFPPRAGSRMRVSFESRKGMCFFSPVDSFPMTFPSVRSDLLMLAPSLSRSPASHGHGQLVSHCHCQ